MLFCAGEVLLPLQLKCTAQGHQLAYWPTAAALMEVSIAGTIVLQGRQLLEHNIFMPVDHGYGQWLGHDDAADC
jgi:hypothetical protein